LEDRSFRAVGDTKTVKTNIRVIAATNKDLRQEIEKQTFREDLYYRLIGHPISTISLSKRPEDLIVLVNHFIRKCELNVDDRVKFILYSYDLPGNVRELMMLLYYTYGQLQKHLYREWVRQQKKQLDNTKEEAVDTLNLKSLVRGGVALKPNEISRKILVEALKQNELSRKILVEALKFTTKKNIDFGKIVRGYEIFQLCHRTDLSKEKIAKHLHIGKGSLSPKQFKTKFGFELPSKDRKYYLISSPLSICNNRKPEPIRGIPEEFFQNLKRTN
jgi:transcriptional regulator with GAF, ATPase, and Fis domain